MAAAARRALVVGATGIVGQNLGARLVADGLGGPRAVPQRRPVRRRRARRCGPTCPTRTAWRAALDGARAASWSRSRPGPGRPTEAENIAVNGGAVRNVLAALEPAGSVRARRADDRAQALPRPVRGLRPGRHGRHARSTRTSRGSTRRTSTTRRRTSCSPRPRRGGFTWSVHRSHTVFGFARRQRDEHGADARRRTRRSARSSGRPFVFPGSATQWNSVTDVTDADLLADQIIWAADHRGRARRGVQHRQRRRLPLALAVAADRRVLRRGVGGLRRRVRAR